MSRKIVFINGSPRPEKESCSKKIIQYFSNTLAEDYPTVVEGNALKLCRNHHIEAHYQEVLTADTLMIIAPLYIDNLPSSVLDYLKRFETFVKENPSLVTHPLNVYAFINCGFLGGYQNYIALEILEHFSNRIGFKWCGGLGVGSGGMLGSTLNIPREAKMQRPIFEGLDTIVHAMKQGTTINAPHKQLLVTQNFSFSLFMFTLNMSWIAQSGFKLLSLYAKPYARK